MTTPRQIIGFGVAIALATLSQTHTYLAAAAYLLP
jgi:hypothetical protein